MTRRRGRGMTSNHLDWLPHHQNWHERRRKREKRRLELKEMRPETRVVLQNVADDDHSSHSEEQNLKTAAAAASGVERESWFKSHLSTLVSTAKNSEWVDPKTGAASLFSLRNRGLSWREESNMKSRGWVEKRRETEKKTLEICCCYLFLCGIFFNCWRRERENHPRDHHQRSALSVSNDRRREEGSHLS